MIAAIISTFLFFKLTVAYDLLHDKYLRIVFGLSGAILIGAILLLAIGLDSGAQIFIIHFTADEGVDDLGGRARIYGVPVAGLLVIFLNIVIADVCYRRNRLLSFLFGFVSLGLAILLFIVSGVIIAVN